MNNAECTISISGTVGSCWRDFYGDNILDIHYLKGGNNQTTIIQSVDDFSSFISIVNRLADLGYPVIKIEYKKKETQNIK